MARLEALGETLRIEDLKPNPPIPPEESLAGHPFVRELVAESATREEHGFDPALRMDRLSLRGIPGIVAGTPRRTTIRYFGGRDLPEFSPSLDEAAAARAILEYCGALAPDLDSFAEAARRPVSHFDLRYEEGFALSMPELVPLRNVADLIAMRAKAALILGDSDRAAEDAITLMRLSEHLREEPSVIPQLVRAAIGDQAVGVLHEGLRRAAWDAAALERLSGEMGDPAYDVGFLRAMRMERAGFMKAMRELRRNPGSLLEDMEQTWFGKGLSGLFAQPVKGWASDNARRHSEILQEKALSDPSGSPVHSGFRMDSLEEPVMAIARNPVQKYRYLLAAGAMPVLETISHRLLRSGVYSDHARLALALEAHRLVQGRLPDSLADLPSGLPVTDPITGEPYRYGILPDGAYQLYSVGSNRLDEGGMLKKDRNAGDWVWRLAIPEDFDPEDYAE